MKPYRILVTGSREVTKAQAAYVENVLYVAVSAPLMRGQGVVIVEGRCPRGGVDRVAQRFAEQTRGCTNEGHPADWDGRGKAAGMIRNSEMVAAGADVCLAFPAAGSRGTWDCLRKAAEAGIHVRIYPLI
jgi:hypothetical protein